MNLGELAPAAGLLLMAERAFRDLGDCLLVWNLGLVGDELEVIARLQTMLNDLQMKLA